MPQKYYWANSDEKNTLRKVLKVSEIILHPDFNTAKASNDIALVRLITLISYIPIINTTITNKCQKYPDCKVKLGTDVNLNVYPPACLPQQVPSMSS